MESGCCTYNENNVILQSQQFVFASFLFLEFRFMSFRHGVTCASFRDFPHSFRPFVLVSRSFQHLFASFQRVRFGISFLEYYRSTDRLSQTVLNSTDSTLTVWNDQSATRKSEAGAQNLLYASEMVDLVEL